MRQEAGILGRMPGRRGSVQSSGSADSSPVSPGNGKDENRSPVNKKKGKGDTKDQSMDSAESAPTSPGNGKDDKKVRNVCSACKRRQHGHRH